MTMTSKIAKFAACVAALGLSLAGGDASAVNINTHGSSCVNYNRGQANDLDQLQSGVRNLATSSRAVICPAVRSPLASGTNACFYVDGTNSSGNTTYFTLTAYNFNSQFQSSQSFQNGDAWYDIHKCLDPVTTYSYVSLLATLPANGGGVFLGLTAVQP
jgi:hypothetical protein